MIYHRSFISELVCAKSALVNRHDDFIGKSTDFYHYGQAHTNNHVFEKHFNQQYQQEPQLMHCVSINRKLRTIEWCAAQYGKHFDVSKHIGRGHNVEQC